ncbi:hypothetical protein ALI144C_08085 [Actinosynnema sp. ALI-1.44]|uniref:hypothetical protein n=1 Tax=Actinosynnema sp. ALI-1.44 TaxID=1933779 RepID=UPI00097CAE01|nr:hypothetical protein [Actinosynnema sp. ALI-1.44]ONI87885.1 hypothetical protein ALI144C_08085 [Actinosynnema sp. ALI-1.44]
MTTQNRSAARHVGPPLALPALAFVLLFVASLVLGPILGAGPTPSPFAGSTEALTYFTDSQTASRVNGFLQFDAAVALGVFTAVATSRMRFLAPHVPGPVISQVGGILAAVFLGLNGLLQWVLGQPDVLGQAAVVRGFQFLFFVLGGPAHTSALGLLIAGIAVTAIYLRALPRWVGVAGVVIAAISVLSLLSMLVEPLALLIPIGRFTGFVWIVAAAFILPRSRELRRPASDREQVPA